MVETTTKHTCGGPKWGKKTPGCPRCDELTAGAEPRSWGGGRNQHSGYPSEREHNQHFARGGPHDLGTCGPVCTFGDW